MTLVVGTTFSHFGGALIADTRVTFSTGVRRDLVQKVFPVGPCIAAGFSGSIAVGFELIQNLRTFLALQEGSVGRILDPASVAEAWSRNAKEVFDRAPETERRCDCRILMVGLTPRGTEAKLIRFAAPTFAPQFIRPGLGACSIGTGAGDERMMQIVRPHVDMRSTPGGLLQGGIAMWAGSLADYLGQESGTHLETGVGRHFHVLTVERNGFSLHTSGRKSFVEWQDEPIDLDPMPATAKTHSQFIEMAEEEGLAAAAASC